jgi:hypothetical protein
MGNCVTGSRDKSKSEPLPANFNQDHPMKE